MGKTRVAGNTIRLDEIEQDEPLRLRLRALAVGEGITLEVSGITGRWERARDPDGDMIRPIGDMKVAWAGIVAGFSHVVAIDMPPVEDGSLATFGLRLHLWDTPENQIR